MSLENTSVLSTEDVVEASVLVDTDEVLSTEVDIPEDSTASILDTLNVLIFDDPVLYPTATDPSIIRFLNTNHSQLQTLNSATVAALIVELTSPKSIDYQFLLDFFLTYRMFLKTNTLLEILMTRFLWAFKLTVELDSKDPTRNETGKLVLIRSFVTIRHWLLNYFQDDFINNNALKVQFVSFINELSDQAKLLLLNSTDKLNIEIGTRILVEMKKVYINLCSIYWSTIPLEHIKQNELLAYPLNLYEHMNNTRLSVMGLQQAYDPSFRRSGILSLYNSKSSSATNLLLQKHNENKAKNLANFLHHNNKSVQKPFKIFAENDRRFLHPKDSLVSLNKSYATKRNPKTPLKPTLTNIIKDEVKYTPLEGVKRLSKNELEEIGKQGFTTNGDIGVFTDSKIHKIIPTTPNKRTKHQSHIKTKKVSFQSPRKPTESGFGKLLHSWKKKFQHHKIDHKEFSPLIDNVSNIIQPDLQKTNSQSTLTDMEPLNLSVRVDVLSARIIEEFQYLLNDQGFKSNLSKQLLNEPKRRQSVFSLALKDDDSMMDNTYSASPTKKSNRDAAVLLEGFGDTDIISFKAPSVSFNWTDSFNDVSNSNSQLDALDDVVPSMINDLKIDDESNKENMLEDTPMNNQNTSKFISQPPVAMKDDEITPVDDGFDFNPTTQQQRISMYSTKSYISYDSQLSKTNEEDELNHNRFSVRRVSDVGDNASLKSYLSYDSALSLQLEDDDLNISPEMKLKKKLPFQDLKSASPKKDSILSSPTTQQSSYMNISLIKVEYDNLMNLAQLPYCVSYVSSSTTNIIKRDSSSFFDLVKEYRLSLAAEDEGLKINDRTIRSIDDSSDDEDSVADYESTISRLDNNLENELFGSEFGSRISMIPSIHSSMIMPFPGLDSAAIAELAAIPDDTFSVDPVAALLMKLEGKYTKEKEPVEKGRICYGLNDEVSLDDESNGQSSIDEVKLQDKVRDLFISNHPNEDIAPPTRESVSTISSTRDLCASTPYKADNLEKQTSKEEAPTLESIMENGSHISFILSYDSIPLAEQLTVIEKDALLEIDWKELIELRWQQTLEPIDSWLQLLLDENKRKGINLVISRFNLMINWIVSEILLTSSLNERKAIITRFIHIAQHCKKLQNYSTLMQIILALTSSKISCLEKTWQQVDPNDRLSLENLEKLASPFKNFANLRNDSKNIIPSKGCIPFLGLSLSDLTFNAERPNFFKRGDANDTVTSIDKNVIDDYMESTKLINFAKFKTSANVVRSLIQCIEWSKLYTINVDNEIVSKCLYIKSLTDEEMNICIEKIGENK